MRRPSTLQELIDRFGEKLVYRAISRHRRIVTGLTPSLADMRHLNDDLSRVGGVATGLENIVYYMWLRDVYHPAHQFKPGGSPAPSKEDTMTTAD